MKNKLAITSLLTAITASLCCITPVLAIIAGSSGIASTFSWIEPFRPYLIGLTILILGFAWYQKLKPENEIDCECETDDLPDSKAGKPKFMQSKTFLGIVTASFGNPVFGQAPLGALMYISMTMLTVSGRFDESEPVNELESATKPV